MTRKEREAQQQHPTLYALNQHRVIRGLGLVANVLQAIIEHITTVKPRRGRKARAPRVRRSTYYGSRQHRMVCIHINERGSVSYE